MYWQYTQYLVVVAHYRVGTDVHAEDAGQGLQLVDEPFTAVLVVLAGDVVDATAGDAVVVRGVGEADLGGAGPCGERAPVALVPARLESVQHTMLDLLDQHRVETLYS